MLLSNLIEDLPKNPNKWARTNVESIILNGFDVIFHCEEYNQEIEPLKENLEDHVKLIKELRQENNNLNIEIETLLIKIDHLKKKSHIQKLIKK